MHNLAVAALLLGTAHGSNLQGFTGHQGLIANNLVLATGKPPVDNFTDTSFDKLPFNGTILHGPTGVNDAHLLGLSGKGVRVAVIDTGISNTHPALRGKIAHQHDLVGYHYGLGDPRRPRSTAETNCSYHGTLTSATVAGEDRLNGFVGVAPGAFIEHFKVGGCDSDVRGIEPSLLADAFQLAVARQPDIISYSIGGGAGPFPDTIQYRAIEAAAASDEIFVVVSNNNDGTNGSFAATESNAANNVLYAGAWNAFKNLPYSWPRGQLSSNGKQQDVGYIPFGISDFPEGEVPLCPLTLDLQDENVACKPLKKSKQDLSKCVAVARQGTNCDLRTQARNIYDAGSRIAVIYANGSAEDGQPLATGAIDFFTNIAGLSYHTGQEILKRTKAGEHLTIKFDPKLKNKQFGGLLDMPDSLNTGVAFFSSWGPRGDLRNTVGMVAPGGVWGPVPESYGGYFEGFGTSFSTPYLAGAAALIKEKFPKLKPSEIRRRLVLSAKPLAFNDGTNATYRQKASVFQQGSGALDMVAALNLETDLSVESIAFNDTQYFTGKASFQLCNRGNDPAEYHVGSIEAATFTAYTAKDPEYYANWNSDQTDFPVPADSNFLSTLVPQGASISNDFTPGTVVGPGKCKPVNVRADISALKALEKRCPLYSGWISVNSNRSEALTLQYLGVGCSMKEHSPLPAHDDRTFLTSETLRRSTGGGQTEDERVFAYPIESGRKFKVPKTQPVSTSADKDRWDDTKTKYPTLVVQPATYTRYDSLSVVASSKNLTREEAKTAKAYDLLPAVVINDSEGGESISHQAYTAWAGQLKNGSFVPPGSYVFRYCCARFWSKNEYDECITTVPFELSYQ